MTTYISPSLPGMIRNLWKSDPSERSVRTALNLAGDLIQELIDLRDQPAAEHHELPNADAPTDAEVRAAGEAIYATATGKIPPTCDLGTYWTDLARAALVAARKVARHE